ncbi:MAG: DUF2274 domain-containing protein [Candidatus Tectimicrobiota bacterium]
MPLRLPHVSVTTVTVTCKFDDDLHADLEAYAATFEAERGKPIPLPTLIATIVQDYLQHDPDFVRERRQAAAVPRVRPTPASTAPRPSSQDRRHGVPSAPVSRPPGEDGAS